MKKILKLAVLLVAFSVFAISASAFTVSDNGSPDAQGGTFAVNVLASAGGEQAGSFTFDANGATFISIAYGTGVIGQEHEGKVSLISLDSAAGSVLATLNFSVTADTFSVSVTGVDEYAGITGSASGALPVAPPPPPPPAPTPDPVPVAPDAGGDVNEKTGVALAIVPVLVAAAATVVSRKRK
ncbi:MAG: hypothetical protein FWG70_00500 [Oscillospiraceae bacterium]|nr:hypothetical protein [Oscillospiraceae bacterium]